MTLERMRVVALAALCAWAAVVPGHAAAGTRDDWELSDSWRFGAGINGFLPDVGLKTNLPDGTSTDVNIGIGTILDHLKMAFSGIAEAQKGRWGGFTDILYIDLGAASSSAHDFSLRPGSVPADVTAHITLDVKATVWTLAGSYRAIANPGSTLDVFAGGRLFDVTSHQAWRLTGNVGSIPLPERSGSGAASTSRWDAIGGVKGRFALSADRSWFVPGYLDVGTGGSQLTWQALGGIGRAFNWGEVTASWRYMYYRDGASSPIEDQDMSGPQIAFVFRW